MWDLCNQVCRTATSVQSIVRKHSAETAEEVIAYADRSRFDIIDITGGAPELNPTSDLGQRLFLPGAAAHDSFQPECSE